MINRKHFYLLSFVLLPLSLWANVVTGVAAIPAGYYSGVDGKNSADAILSALNARITNHTVISYSGLEPYYEQTDVYADTIWDIYSTCCFHFSDGNSGNASVCAGWNKEHTVPQSWFGEKSPMKSDLFHVYPTDARVNGFRSNYPYGEVSGPNGTGFKDNYKGHGLGKVGSNTFSGYSGKVFEPADEFKGDLARTYFYMVARYRDQALNVKPEGAAMFKSNKTDLTDFARNLMLKWHRQDPVSQKEVDRNQAVYGIQKNRNPFIDYPELVEYIWGNKVGQTVNLASLTPTCGAGDTPVDPIDPIDPDPGDPPLPPTPELEDMFIIIWMVDGVEIRRDTVKADEPIPSFPKAPQSCSSTSETFVGWSASTISGMTDMPPQDLFTEADLEPIITEDVTYHAVFAHKELPGGEQKVTADLSKYRRGMKPASAKAGDVTIKFDQNQASAPATAYTELRCYPGSLIILTGATMTRVEWVAGANDNDNPMSVNTGTMDELVWTGQTDNLVFSIGGEDNYRGFSAVHVTYLTGSGGDASGADFRMYLTECNEQGREPGLEGIETADDGRSTGRHAKVLVNGQLYIFVDGHLYTLTGQRIR